MFAGHFGLAAAVKAKYPEVPLWGVMLGTQLLDVAFIPFLLTGKETIERVDDFSYGGNIIHADYTHSLIVAVILALLSGLLAWRLWGNKGGIVISSVVFSHWLLDLIVHRPDMPLLPGNAGNLPLLGFGLWKIPFAAMGLEFLLLAVGAIIYARSFAGRPKMKAFRATGMMGILLLLAFLSDVFAIG